MKVLHVSTYDLNGGAARATYRLHKALIAHGLDSRILVQRKQSDEHQIVGPSTLWEKACSLVIPFVEKIFFKLCGVKPNSYFSSSLISGKSFINRINDTDADLIHFHWVNDGMIKFSSLDKIKKPIVWTMHDNWLFTGGCHIKMDCEKFIDQCGKCPVLSSTKESDLSSRIQEMKIATIERLNNLIVVGPSKWIVKEAQKSKILKNVEIVHIPNLINTEIFKPISKTMARDILNLSVDKKYVMFGALDPFGDKNKGFLQLKQSLDLIESSCELIIFGASEPKDKIDFGHVTHYFGKITDEVMLAILYSASDAVVVPSLQENFSNTILESLSCGTPVVAFNIGGNTDLVEHKTNGFVAEAFSVTSLAEGIDWLLNCSYIDEISFNARRSVLKNYSSEALVKKFIGLYDQYK